MTFKENMSGEKKGHIMVERLKPNITQKVFLTKTLTLIMANNVLSILC